MDTASQLHLPSCTVNHLLQLCFGITVTPRSGVVPSEDYIVNTEDIFRASQQKTGKEQKREEPHSTENKGARYLWATLSSAQYFAGKRKGDDNQQQSIPANGTVSPPKPRRTPKHWATTLSPKELAVEQKIFARMSVRSNMLSRSQRFEVKNLSLTTTSKSDISPVPLLVDPPEVQFRDFDVGQQYEASVTIQNTSKVGLRLRLTPPTASEFTAELHKLPTEHGFVAPGMSCQCHIRFFPRSPRNLDDVVTLVSELGHVTIPLRAFRPPPCPTLPAELECGACLVDKLNKTSFLFRNDGGPAKFTLRAKGEGFGTAAVDAPRGYLELPPFRIWPTEFELKQGEESQLEVLYMPPNEKEHKQEFVMHSNSGDSWSHQLRGRGCLPLVRLVNERKEGEDPQTQTVHFGRQVVGTAPSKIVVVQSDVPVQLPYRWAIMPPADEPTAVDKPCFAIAPAKGVLQPNERAEFAVQFRPEYSGVFNGVAILIVEDIPASLFSEPRGLRSIGQPTHSQAGDDEAVDLSVVRLDIQGDAVPPEACLFPPAIVFPAVLTCGQPYKAEGKLINRTGVPLSYRYSISASSEVDCKVSPESGSVAPFGNAAFSVEVTPKACVVPHFEKDVWCIIGGTEPLLLRVTGRTAPQIALHLPAVIDFGIVKAGVQHSTAFLLTNHSHTAVAWSLSAVLDEGSTVKLSFEPVQGTIEPLQTARIAVLLFGEEPQKLRGAVELKCGERAVKYAMLKADLVPS